MVVVHHPPLEGCVSEVTPPHQYKGGRFTPPVFLLGSVASYLIDADVRFTHSDDS